MKPLNTAISEFLFFGFIPNEIDAQDHIRELENVAATSIPFDSLQSMKDVLVRIVDSLLPRNTDFVVPVSSGFDSRGLLGAALECREANQISTYTFGHPGTVDFELTRNLISGGIRNHFLVDVSKKSAGSWNTEALIDKVSSRPSGLVLAVGETGSGLIHDRLESLTDLPRLNGYLGDSISGKKLNSPPDMTWESAVAFFIKKNRPYKGPLGVTHPDFDPFQSLPRSPLSEQMGNATLNDQLDWGFRQRQRVAFFVGALSSRSQSKFPYAHGSWRGPWMWENPKERIGQTRYREFLTYSFPKIFPDLTDNPGVRYRMMVAARNITRSKTLSRSHVDLDRSLIVDTSFQAYCRENLSDLKARGVAPWIDFLALEALLAERHPGIGRLMYALASLEINFKAGRFDQFESPDTLSPESEPMESDSDAT